MTTKTLHVLLVGVGLLSGCDLVSSQGGREVGIIGTEGAGLFRSEAVSRDRAAGAGGGESQDPLALPVLEAPDTVAAGASVEITVRTLGPNGCWREDGATVSSSAFEIEIVPYDRVAGQNCTDAVRRLARRVIVRFDEPGEAVLRVTGRIVSWPAGEQTERLDSIERSIVVR